MKQIKDRLGGGLNHSTSYLKLYIPVFPASTGDTKG